MVFITETAERRDLVGKLRTLAAALSVSAPLALGSCQDATDVSPVPQVEEVPTYSVVLRPTLDASGDVDAIEVSSVLTGGLEQDAQALKLIAPVVYVNVEHIADRITQLQVTDNDGEIPFTTEDDPPVPGGYPYFRHWTAGRPAKFPVRISYRALVQPPGGPRGPAFGIRPSAGGISGAGAGFMLVPENAASEESELSWDLSAFDKPSVGVSTFGDGAVEVDGPPTALMQGWYLAGPAEQYPAPGTESKFHAYWLGNFPFDEQSEMAFTSEMYSYFETYFDHLNPAPDYRVFMRQLDTPPYGGGTALANSFMLSRGPVTEDEANGPEQRTLFVHELLHLWSGSLDGEAIATNWFSEGLTTYFEYTLPFRAGRLSFEDYLDGLNTLSRKYYTNPARDWPISEIRKVGFNDDEIRHVPYQRGALYFADLDARLLQASGGKTGLHAFVNRVLKARETGEVDLTPAVWSAYVTEALGKDDAPFVQVLHEDGMVFFPAPESFGRCVRGERTVYERAGKSFDGMKWVPVPGVPPEACFEDK